MTKHIRSNCTPFGATLLLAIWIAGCGNSRAVNPSGTLEATEVDIAATLSGRIVEVRAALGEQVNMGDTLIVLDTELLRLQRAQNEANRVSIHAQRRVTQDALAQAKENLKLADVTLSRIKILQEQGSATAQQLDETRTKRDVTAAQVSAANHQLDAL
ncbi:biotin/lipoyl-binding protein, partial [bacterium]|nr:biotin/lipoyl-binding protein [bacterium]